MNNKEREHLEEFVKGCVYRAIVELGEEVKKLPFFAGNLYPDEASPPPCPSCKGKGYTEFAVKSPHLGVSGVQVCKNTCLDCSGSGV